MRFPKHAKLVFKGLLFDVYQWQQEMFDGSQSTFEGLKRTGTIQVIPTQGDKILISHEEQPLKPKAYTFFGGRQEKNEDALEAAKRELLEESGMESSDWELIKSYPNRGKIDWNTYLFLARNCKKVSEPHLDPGEKIEIIPVNFDRFLKIVSSEDFWGLPQVVIDILKMRLDKQKLIEFEKKLFPNS